MLSILIPAYNAARFIEAAIRSCVTQVPEGEYCILVCDDGSADETASIVARLATEISALRFFQNPSNLGVCAARNLLLDNLPEETRYVSFLDADDILIEGALGSSLAKLEAAPGKLMSVGKMQIVPTKALDAEEPISPDWPILIGVTLSASVYRVELIFKVGKFDTSFSQGEDCDYLLRLAELTDQRLVLDEVIFYYRRHDANTTKNTQQMKSGFMRALLLHANRRKANPALLSGKGLFPKLDSETIRKMEDLQLG